jgi:hypothetical protein
MARNPMLDVLGGANRQSMPQSNPMAMMGQLRQMVGMLRGQDPQKVVLQMAQRNPQFAAFVQQNQGKTVEQIAAENGIDMGFVRELMR